LGDGWVGVLAPNGTPKDVVTLLNRAIVAIIVEGDMAARLEAFGYRPIGSTPEQFSERFKVDGNLG
jgi:tripartite-type tricarboxylate transporter receptor subunit TctC